MTTRARRCAGLVSACLALAACGGDQPLVSNPSVGHPVAPPVNNAAPTLSGQPDPIAVVGMTWSFQPTSSDADGDALVFHVQNAPDWTDFDAATGRLEGTPGEGDIGTWTEIVITVTDGLGSGRTPPFSIDVRSREGVTGSATLSWHPPTERVDGSPIGELAGYRIQYGKASLQYDSTAEIDNPSVTRYVVESLTPGTWYFAVTAITADGLESAPSTEVSTTIGG